MIDDMFRRPFRLLGMVFLVGAFVLIALGAWTFTFSEAEGELVELSDRKMTMSGAYSGVPLVRARPAQASSLSVEYRYRVKGQRMKGTRIGMGLAPWSLSPFRPMQWERHARIGAEVTVYHAPDRPSVSVLHRGVDLVSTAMLVLMGVSLLLFSAWLERHRHPQEARDG